MPRVYQTALWRLQVPDAWTGKVWGEHGAFFCRDGVGHLQVYGSDSVDRHDLLAYARDHSPPGTTFTEASCGRLRGIAGILTDRNTLWRTWWLLCRGQLVYAVYQCATKNSQDERADLEQILQSFDESSEEAAWSVGLRTAITDVGFVLTVFLPSLRSEDVKITVVDNTVRITVKRAGNYVSQTEIHVPSEYRPSGARANYLNGQLRIVIPKSAA